MSPPVDEEATITGAMLLAWARATESDDLDWIREHIKPGHEITMQRAAVHAADGYVWATALLKERSAALRDDPRAWASALRGVWVAVDEQQWRDAVTLTPLTKQLLEDDDFIDLI